MITKRDEFIPAEAIPVGEYIQDELDAREWSRLDLAGRTGFSEAELSDVIENRTMFRVTYAERIGRAFGIDSQTLLNLNASYKRYLKKYGKEPSPSHYRPKT